MDNIQNTEDLVTIKVSLKTSIKAKYYKKNNNIRWNAEVILSYTKGIKDPKKTE